MSGVRPAPDPGALSDQVLFDGPAFVAAITRIREPVQLVTETRSGRMGVVLGRGSEAGASADGSAAYQVAGTLPPLYPEWLGDRAFTEAHHLRFPYVAGEMANGIATTDLVVAMARAQMLGFFGAAGLSLPQVERALDEIEAALGTEAGSSAAVPSWGTNLIHSPSDAGLEDAVAELYLRRGVRRISASAFMALSPAVVRVAASGLSRDAAGRIQRRHQVFAKVSRREVAEAFMAPAPRALLEALVRQGQLTREEAALAEHVPVAEDVTVEADSGGHTDNRPLVALFPSIRALADQLALRHGYARPIRVGVAGGLGTPTAVAAAFALGAAYVVTGTVNQATVEAGLSDEGKRMLADAALADVIMAPAADMFEMGVKVQVLRRGTLFGMRALRLYELYRAHESLEALPAAAREALEREILGAKVEAVWSEVQRHFAARDPRELARAEREPRHRMALVFRWYLGLSSRWAIDGDAGRRADYQIWCGPAMGAFNDWVKGSALEPLAQRSAVQVALNLMEGAAVITRAQQLRSAGVAIPASAFAYAPRMLA